ncbi:MAG: hypothetical protein GWP75_13070 [Planctomycetia bacterium]|jgi:hypothetical protein|nr:hypothetical protein [Planctomycetia bacterium]
MDTFDPILNAPLADEDPAVERAQAMFNRVLASWASDLLHLRRQELTTPGWRVRVDQDDETTWRRAA